MQAILTPIAKIWQRLLGVGLLLAVAVVIAACSGGTDPFSKDGPTTAPPKGKTPPAIIIRTISGMPPDMARNLKVALAVSAGQRDIGIVEGDMPGGTFSLEGAFSAVPAGGATRITYQWTLRDTKGYVIDQPSGEANAPGGADPWAGVDATVLQQISDQTAQALAAKLSTMGFATRLSTLLTPPSETFAMAGPGASQEIDYETLNGPGAVDPTLPPAEALASAAPLAPAEEPPALLAEAKADDTPAPKKTVIRAVAVLPVKGAPGQGNDELTQAMRATLKSAGWPVISAPREDAITISGHVQLADGTDGNQTVKLSWLIKDPTGATLGDVKQANAVPAGSLNSGFGEDATAVVEAAATGIFDLIKTYR